MKKRVLFLGIILSVGFMLSMTSVAFAESITYPNNARAGKTFIMTVKGSTSSTQRLTPFSNDIKGRGAWDFIALDGDDQIAITVQRPGKYRIVTEFEREIKETDTYMKSYYESEIASAMAKINQQSYWREVASASGDLRRYYECDAEIKRLKAEIASLRQDIADCTYWSWDGYKTRTKTIDVKGTVKFKGAYANSGSYKLVEGKSSALSKLYSYGQKYGKLPKIKKSGRTLDGWYTKAKGGKKIKSTTSYKANKPVTILYPHWS